MEENLSSLRLILQRLIHFAYVNREYACNNNGLHSCFFCLFVSSEQLFMFNPSRDDEAQTQVRFCIPGANESTAMANHGKNDELSLR